MYVHGMLSSNPRQSEKVQAIGRLAMLNGCPDICCSSSLFLDLHFQAQVVQFLSALKPPRAFAHILVQDEKQ